MLWNVIKEPLVSPVGRVVGLIKDAATLIEIAGYNVDGVAYPWKPRHRSTYFNRRHH